MYLNIATFYIFIFYVVSEDEIMSKLLQKLIQHTCRRHAVHVASHGHVTGGGRVDAFELMRPQLDALNENIHNELEKDLVVSSEIGDLAK